MDVMGEVQKTRNNQGGRVEMGKEGRTDVEMAGLFFWSSMLELPYL